MKKYIELISILVLCLAGLVSSSRAQDVKKYSLGIHGTYSRDGDVVESKYGFGIQTENSINEFLSTELALSGFRDGINEEIYFGNESITTTVNLNIITIGISAIFRISKGYLLGGFNYNVANIELSNDSEMNGKILHDEATIYFKDDIGYHIGAGLNFPLSENWNIFTEYRYTYLTLNRMGNVKVLYKGNYYDAEFPKIYYDFGLVKIGINYLF